MGNDRQSERGMTLLELLVALALLALTGLLLSEGFTLGTKLRDRVEKEVRATVAWQEAARTLRMLVEQAEPVSHIEALPPFRGDARSLTFFTFAAARLTGGFGRQVRLYHDAEREELRLEVTDPGAGGTEPGQTVSAESDLALLADSISISMRYFGYGAPGEPAVWTDRWADYVNLPLLVEIMVETRNRPEPLVLRIAPQLRWPVACLIGSGSACRAQRQ